MSVSLASYHDCEPTAWKLFTDSEWITFDAYEAFCLDEEDDWRFVKNVNRLLDELIEKVSLGKEKSGFVLESARFWAENGTMFVENESFCLRVEFEDAEKILRQVVKEYKQIITVF